MASCSDDFDCKLGLLCYRDVTWLPANVSSLCGCNMWEGMVGSDCTGLSQQSGAILFIVTAVFLGAALALAVNVWLLWSIACAPQLRHWSTQSVTLVFAFISLLGLCEWRACRFAAIFYPNSVYGPEALPHISFKVNIPVLAEKVGLSLAVLFGLLAALNLSIRWIEVARTSAHMVNMDSSLWGENKRKIWLFQLLFCVVLSLAVGLGKFDVAIFAALPLLIFVFSTFVYALVKFNAILMLLDPALDCGNLEAAVKRSTGAESKKSQASQHGSFAERSFVADGDSSSDDDGDDDDPHLQRSPTGSRLVGSIANSVRKLTITAKASSRLNSQATYYELLSRVRRTVTIVVLAGVFFIICALGFAIPESRDGFRETCPLPLGSKPQFCSIAIWQELMSVAVFILVLAVQNNVRDDTLAHLAALSCPRASGATTNISPSRISH